MAQASSQLAATTPPPVPLSPFAARIVALHNSERRNVGAPAMAWDPVLAAGAAQWADYLARNGLFEHSDRRARPGVGENLASGSRGYFSVDALVGTWIGERRYFIPGTFPNNSSNGNWAAVSHYTQMIWPTTTRLGCAMASGRGRDVLVCRYSPKGNVDGRPVGYGRSERG